MLTTRVLDAAAVEAEGWADALLALDRENLEPMLRQAGTPFPEEKRRRGMRDPTATVVLLLDGGRLAGYAQFSRDWSHPDDVHVGSLQLRAPYRRGRALAVLLVECARALEARPFARLRAGVHRDNHAAARLCRKLGFRVSERPGSDTSLDVTGGRELLDSPLLHRLRTAVAGRYRGA
jgi:ribosomal protein S18 acetylase RimI-like enzyme